MKKKEHLLLRWQEKGFGVFWGSFSPIKIKAFPCSFNPAQLESFKVTNHIILSSSGLLFRLSSHHVSIPWLGHPTRKNFQNLALDQVYILRTSYNMHLRRELHFLPFLGRSTCMYVRLWVTTEFALLSKNFPFFLEQPDPCEANSLSPTNHLALRPSDSKKMKHEVYLGRYLGWIVTPLYIHSLSKRRSWIVPLLAVVWSSFRFSNNESWRFAFLIGCFRRDDLPTSYHGYLLLVLVWTKMVIDIW